MKVVAWPCLLLFAVENLAAVGGMRGFGTEANAFVVPERDLPAHFKGLTVSTGVPKTGYPAHRGPPVKVVNGVCGLKQAITAVDGSMYERTDAHRKLNCTCIR